MEVSMKDPTFGTTSTMVMTEAEVLGEGGAPVVTVVVLHQSIIGVLDKGGIQGFEMEQTLGREQLMRTDTQEVTIGKDEAARVVVGAIKGTRVGRHTLRLQG